MLRAIGRRRVAAASLLAALCAALATAARGDEIRFLVSEREAAAARVEMILGAKDEILVAYFIVGDDPFTLTALSLLRDAARRGVAVKLLIDDQWNKLPPAVEARLVAEGVQIRTYHPFFWSKLHWITRRLHDKLLL